jgi:type 2 lantibiotic biosynthesis protein LanM
MQITQEDLIKIVEQASTIPERLGTKFLFNPMQADDNVVNDRIERWCQTVADKNKAKFEKRLAWDDLDLDTIRQVLGSVRLADQQDLPAWAETLRAVLEFIVPDSADALGKSFLDEKYPLDSKQPLPFEELFLSFIDVARQRLAAQSGSNYFLLSSESHATLERSLLQSLTSLCSQALGETFLVFRLYEQPSLIRLIGQIEGSHSTEQYCKFIRKMLAGELLDFFQEYPVLARLVATVTNFWVNNLCEFLQRLASDWLNIQATFQGNAELGQVVAIQPGLSDPHCNGRSVIKITFASGLKLIYKPKALGLEEAYFRLVAWFNENGIPQQLKVLQLINCSDYGWVEYVEHSSCADELAVVRYYQRAGMLLCLLYSLSGTDFHQENIIACGEQPVPIDLEMLMSAMARQEESVEGTNALFLAFEQFTYSVLSTDLLPSWQLGQDGFAYDMSGLGGSGNQQTNYHKLVWQNINTDGMVLRQEAVKTPSCSNIVTLNGVQISLSDYVEELVEGFEQMYQFLITHKQTLMAANSPLVVLAHQQVRAIFRATQVYSSLLKETLQPKFLRNGVDRSIALDVLSRSLLKHETKPNSWHIIAAEQKALSHLDIPIFSIHPYSKDLKISTNQSIKDYFVDSSYNHVMTRFDKLNETDLAQQIGFIRSSLYTNFASDVVRSLPSSGQPTLSSDAIAPIARETLIEQAIVIALELQERAVCATDGSVTWIGMEYLPFAGRLQQKPMGYDFYDGASGVALFLCALAKVTRNEENRNLALGALQPLFNLLRLESVDRQAMLKKIGIGGGKGVGSILYALVRCSQFLEEPALLSNAQSIASLIMPELIASDRKFDVVSGAAGTLLGLLTLHKVTAKPAVLEQAIACGYHLLNHRVASDAGLQVWKTLNGKILTGFSHGAAGIAYALLRLYEITQDNVFLAAATEAIAYEQSVFSPNAQNYPDFRGEKPEFLTSWCHGAPGIGLARLGGLAILDTDEIRQEIEIALQTTQMYGMHEIDHLCCGNFGCIEVLLVGAQYLKRLELAEIVQNRAAWVVNRAINMGSFQIFPSPFQGIYNPGFFQGTAGIGYELLRLAYPEKLPSVLLWQ